jgi:hypothetical protein
MKTKGILIAAVGLVGTVISLHVGNCPMKGHCMNQKAPIEKMDAARK